MSSFEIPADIFTRLSVFDSPKGSSNTFKTRKKYQPLFQKKAPNNINIWLNTQVLLYTSRFACLLGDRDNTGLLTGHMEKYFHELFANSGELG